MMENENRVIVLIDMDCFYCQVEEKLNPDLKGKPIAVVQYNPWKGGGIIAVNYVARAQGVTRHMRGDEAKEKCPEIELPSVPCLRGKADISKYRDAGKDVAKVLQKFTPLLERASIDEAYLDITSAVSERLKTLNTSAITTEMMPNTYALGYDTIHEFVADVDNYGNDCIDFDYENAKMLLVGAVVVSEIRAAVYNETGYRCSAGIAHNKILAKLVCGMNKPNKQTILPKHSINILYKTLPLKKVKHLGGKFGDSVRTVLKINTMGELQNFALKELQAKFDEKNGMWLYNIARGIDLEPVQARFNPKSIGCCKQFRGKSALLDFESLRKWLRDLGAEIEDRLEKDALETNRTPKQMVVSFSNQLPDGRDVSSSRSYNFVADDELCADFFSFKALDLVMENMESSRPNGDEKNKKLEMPIKFLGISVGKFEDNSEIKKTRKIIDFFGAGSSKTQTAPDKTEKENTNATTSKSEKKKAEKEFILQKYFQTTSKKQEIKSKINVTKPHDIINQSTEPVLQTPLEKQESFFAKFLHKEPPVTEPIKPIKLADVKKTTDNIRPITPVCKIVECEENSNDSDYSSSTINQEINKSIALFDDDTEDINRVSSMRELLNNSTVVDRMDEDNAIVSPKPDTSNVISKESSPEPNNTIKCDDCGKTIPIEEIQTHADYHLALMLREEERQNVRKEREAAKVQIKKVAVVKEEPKNDANTSIANFLVKVDTSVPTEICGECGKKIPTEKFSEHLDFHEAQKLSRELNKKTVINNFSSNSVKRKRKSISPVKKSKIYKSIDSFFK